MSDVTTSGRPLQRIPWSEKIAKNKEWFKRNADYHLSLCNFNFDGDKRKDISLLYQVYNNQYPAKWFAHITDPLSAKDAKHKNFPGKIRPVSILRPNLDLLMGEYPRRPFVYQVMNMGEDGYNRFTSGLTAKIEENLTQHFVAAMQQQAADAGVPVNEVPGLDEVELPDSLKEKFGTSYKDALAIRGQHWLRRALSEHKIKEKFEKMFKDWLISGYTRSYKGILHGQLVYEHISPLQIDSDKSPDVDYIEDGEWAVCRRFMTFSDVVDHFYDELTEANYNELETRAHFASPGAFYSYLNSTYNNKDSRSTKIPVYHIVWKGKKKKKVLTYPDPVSGQLQTMEVDEDYIVDKDAGESAETIYGNEVYETWRIGDRIYARMQAIPVQRNEMNNTSACKLPYNGRAFSDTHAEGLSVLEIGLPFQIMYMITNRTLEMTIAKSKGKIFLIDKNAIPRKDGWNDEKFFYYSEAMGYALLDRNQIGVDKTFNQYQVVDMGLFDQIEKLIALQDHFKQQWDDSIGINRPRKGATYASDGKAVSEMGINQSSIITDTIFTLFEKFVERELQGLIDFSRFTEAEGTRTIYNSDDYTTALHAADPVAYANAELGVLLSSSVEEKATLDNMKMQVQALIQNQVKPSTVLTMLQAQNVAELKQQLRKIEEMEAAMTQQEQMSEQEAQQAADERNMRFREFEAKLDSTLLSQEWDRKDQNTILKAEYEKEDGDVNADGIDDGTEREKIVIDKLKMLTDAELEREKQRSAERMHSLDLVLEYQKLHSTERIAEKKNETDIRKARYSKSKPATKK